ncbi:MAG: hypothetical protein V3R25_09975 [Nitrosomonadaceae bacterium]
MTTRDGEIKASNFWFITIWCVIGFGLWGLNEVRGEIEMGTHLELTEVNSED